MASGTTETYLSVCLPRIKEEKKMTSISINERKEAKMKSVIIIMVNLTHTGLKWLHILYMYILSKFNIYNMNAHTRVHTHTHTRACMQAHRHAHTQL